MIARLALREIRANPRFAAGFCLNLALGLFGFVLLSAFQAAMTGTFRERSRALLTADLAISARRAVTAEELATVRRVIGASTGGPTFRESFALELYSMAKVGERSRLVEVVATSENYPLYGEIRLQNPAPPLGKAPAAWVSPELAAQLELGAGDGLRLGEQDFRVSAIIAEDASAGAVGFSFAPRLYIGLPWIDKTGLVRRGSTVNYTYFFALPPQADPEAIARELDRALADSGVRVVSHLKAGEQMSRALSYLTDYLGLVSLVGLFLAALGSAYLFQSFLSRRLREIATLITLGVSPGGAVLIYLFQSLALGLVSSGLALVAAYFALPAASAAAGAALGISLRVAAGLSGIFPVVVAALIGGVAASVLICLPLAMQLRGLKPASLFQESSAPRLRWTRGAAASAIPAVGLAYLLSVAQAHSWKVGSLFFGGLLVSGIGLALIAGLALRGLARVPRWPNPTLRLAARYLLRNRLSTLSAFLAIGLGTLLINLLPQLQQSIESEIEHPEVSSVPSLFLFDIQEEQVERLRQALRAERAEVMQLSPLVRARLEAINGKPFEKATEAGGSATTREEEQEARSRNRGFNLTFRERLSESESLVAGRKFSGSFEATREGDVAEISVEERFAERLGLKLEDRLRFTIESVPVEGRITSLRKVRWTSFQPNFFVVFQPGALTDAPKTFLGSIGRLSLQDRARVQARLVREFNNVSIVDVTTVVQRMLGAFQQMTLALRLMAALAVLAGLVVVFAIANHQAKSRRAEIQLLKVLGAGTRDVTRVFLAEFAAIGLLSSALGASISMALSYAISTQLFDSAWKFSLGPPLATVAAVTALTVVTAFVAALRSLAEKPAELLSGETI